MTTYDTWDDIPNGVTVYVPSHRLLAIKISSTTIVSAAEFGGKTGWIQTTGRYQGPFEGVDEYLVPELQAYPYQRGDTTVIGPECFAITDKGAIAWQGVWYFDPDLELHRLPPGEEPLVPRPEPRQWGSLLDVPQGVKVLDKQGDVWKCKRGYWLVRLESGWSRWNLLDKSTFAPYTEIVK